MKQTLHEAKKKKEVEIERICNRHYQDFLGSVQEIVQMKGSAGQLKSAISQMHTEFCTTGQELVNVLTDLDVLQEGELLSSAHHLFF